MILACFSAVVLLANVVSGQRKAVCNMASGSGSGPVSGKIELSQSASGASVTVKVDLQGLNPAGKHGFHVHANSSLGGKCVEAAGHLNAENTLHGAPSDVKQQRHTGDLGNVDSVGGVVSTTITDYLISLYDGPTSVIGKPFVVHAMEDDLGKGGAATSNTTGNAGARLGCCLIELTESGSSTRISSMSAGFTLILALCVLIGRE